MNSGSDLTPTPTICLLLMQWNANGISGKINELLTFLHSSNVNIAVIQEKQAANKTKLLKMPGWAAVRCLLMLIKGAIPFVDNMIALPQPTDPHLEQQGISVVAHLPTTAHLHSATWQLQRWSQRINHAPPLQQQNVAYCWGY